jgi:hypothetical protein
MATAIVDNIPVMFAVLAMQPAMDHGQWLLVTLTAGVGGSLLSIGSAAGVAVMGQARGIYTFFAHLKWTWAIALGYAASIWVHFLINGRHCTGVSTDKYQEIKKAERCPAFLSRSRRSGFTGCLLKQWLQLTLLEHLQCNIVATDQFTVHINLRERWPVCKTWQVLENLRISQHVNVRKFDITGLQHLYSAAGITAHRHLRRAFHENDDRIAINRLFNPFHHIHYCLPLKSIGYLNDHEFTEQAG